MRALGALRRAPRYPQRPPSRSRAARSFRLEDVGTEVQVWHGELDRSDPIAMARSQARRLANAQVRYVADGGHLVLFGHAGENLAGVHG